MPPITGAFKFFKPYIMAKREKDLIDDKENNNNSTSIEAENSSKNQMENKNQTPLYEFFLSGLKDILYAENQLVDALVEMENAATTEELKDAFEDHHLLTKKHVSRLQKAFKHLNEKDEPKECKAIKGLIEEAREIIKSTDEGTITRDVALIIAAQKIEHYEIATYGGLAQLAITLELDKVADLLEKTLEEEEDTDEKLTEIAESHINVEAEKED